jgi:hypothetical protein
MSRLKSAPNGSALLCKMMGLPEKDPVLKTAAAALKRSHAVVHVQHGKDGRVESKNITALDPVATDEREWGWGGLTGFSAQVADVVASTRAAQGA